MFNVEQDSGVCAMSGVSKIDTDTIAERFRFQLFDKYDWWHITFTKFS
jgi:hypothetical protein